jgi:multimeric flavodoxin WrbA
MGASMKITAFNGSHYKGKSNTQLMVEEFLAGAAEAGAQTESILLIDRDVRPCTRCMECFAEGHCSLKDDMPSLIQKFVNSDVVVLATPLYMDMVSGLMKTFIDRLLPLLDPHFEKDERGEYRHTARYERRADFVVISNGHMPEESQFQAVRLFMARFARSLHTQVIGEIYRSAGGLLNSEEAAFKAAVKAYKQLLRDAGSELVLKGRISERTASELEKDLVPVDKYIAYANRMWDKLLHVSVK